MQRMVTEVGPLLRYMVGLAVVIERYSSCRGATGGSSALA